MLFRSKNFPSGKNAEYLTKWVTNTRAQLFNDAVKAKNSDAMIRLGNEALAAEPQNLDYLMLLIYNLSTNELYANPRNNNHAAETGEFSRRAIKLVEAGSQPATATKWNKDESLSYLYQILGTIEEQNKNIDHALECYVKAGTLDPLNVNSFFSSGRIYQERYLKAADQFRALPDADRNAAEPSPKTKALLKEANDAADATIDSWVKFLKLTATNNAYGAARDEVLKTVEELYKYRHPDSPDGFQQLIKP